MPTELDPKSLWSINYGIYVVTSAYDGKANGQTTVMDALKHAGKTTRAKTAAMVEAYQEVQTEVYAKTTDAMRAKIARRAAYQAQVKALYSVLRDMYRQQAIAEGLLIDE